MLNVCIVVHASYTNHLYMPNVSICLMYALLYTTICVNMLTTKTIYMLNVSI